MTKTAAQYKAETIELFKTTRDRLAAALEMRRGVIVSHGWVVRMRADGGALKLQIEAGGFVVGSEVVNTDRATQLTREDAETVAKAVRNGAGEVGQAVPYTTALRDEIAAYEKLIAEIEAIVLPEEPVVA